MQKEDENMNTTNEEHPTISQMLEHIDYIVGNTMPLHKCSEIVSYITIGDNLHYKITIKKIKKLPTDVV
jgi:hypothetical protein